MECSIERIFTFLKETYRIFKYLTYIVFSDPRIVGSSDFRNGKRCSTSRIFGCSGCTAWIPESPLFRHLLFSLPAIFRSRRRNTHNFEAESLSTFFVLREANVETTRARFRNEIRRWLSVEQDFCSEFSVRAGIFTVFSLRIRVVANSQGAFRLWIRIRKLEATTTRRRRGSPVCKKELSSNRINDPLASIYRGRWGRWGRRGRRGQQRGGRTRRRDVQGRTRRTVFQRGRSGSCFSTSSFCRALPLCAENIICFLAVLGSLCRRRKFNRARAPPPDASVNPVFGYILSLGCGTSVRCSCQKKKVSYNPLLGEKNP